MPSSRPERSPFDVINAYPPHDGTLHGMFLSRCGARAGEIFLIQDERRLTWREFGDECDRLARALSRRGIANGSRVAVIGLNDITHVTTLFAAARLGAAMVPLNPDFTRGEMQYQIQHADVQGLIIERRLLGQVGDILQAIGSRAWVLVLDAAADEPDSVQAALRDSLDHPLPPPAGRPDSTCVIIYTSGTTGLPKGVMHSQSNFLLAGEANVERMHLQPEDRLMVVLPFFHMNALFYSLGGALAAGASVLVTRKFSASSFWHTAADHGATITNIIEAIGTILCARPASEYRHDHTIRAIYGVRKKSEPAFRERFGIPRIFSGFGMTEVPGVTCNPYDAPNKAGSMGVIGRHPDPARAWARCRVVDESGVDVPVGTAGELLIQSPIFMQGYFRDPEQTRLACIDGWFKTGDLVRQDADGFYFHLSRKKDIIRRRGENISAAELEHVIGAHPAVYEVAALAVPSELGEDDILVVISLLDGQQGQLSPQDVLEWCRDRLAPIKTPRYVAFLPELPRTPTHKIAKHALRQDPDVLARMTDLQPPTAKHDPSHPEENHG